MAETSLKLFGFELRRAKKAEVAQTKLLTELDNVEDERNIYQKAYDENLVNLSIGGFYRYRKGEEKHSFEAGSIHMLQAAVSTCLLYTSDAADE